MAFDESEKTERTADELLALLRLYLRLGLLAAMIIGLLYLAVRRREFFPPDDFAPPPLVEHLPLPVPEIAPHENPAPAVEAAVVAATETVPPETTKVEPVKVETPPVAAVEPPKIDWAKTPLTAPIPNAYIVVYLSHKVLGIVVDGQYARTYYQLGLPANLATRTADDGQLPPIGDFRVAGHELRDNVMLLKLDETHTTIRGDNVGEGKITLNEIAITPAQMQELWTAIADGAVVMIRP